MIPDNAPQPQDHKKKKSAAARKAEADGFATIKQCGIELRIPMRGKIPLEAVDALLEGGPFAEALATKIMLGADQWAELVKAGATTDDLQQIGEKIAGYMGN